jgi:melibiase-like protein
MLLAATGCAAADSGSLASRDVYAHFDGKSVSLRNAVVERDWSRSALRTTTLLDKRSGGRRWSTDSRDFLLDIGGATIGSEDFRVASVGLERLAPGGIRVTMTLVGSGAAAGLRAVRTAEAYPGVAGFRMQTTLTSTAPLVLSKATLDLAGVGGAVTPVVRSFRAGTDWRNPGWAGPPLWVGYRQAGDVRQDVTGSPGKAVEANAEWLDARAGGRALFMVMERNDLPSSRAAYDGATASLRVDYTKDVIDLGPLEQQAHFENPSSGGGRARALQPGEPFALEPTFTGFAVGDGDTEWQWHKYLAAHRVAPYDHTVAWNSNEVDQNQRSTGSKDDMDMQAVEQVAPILRRLGVETFVLDDGWASRDGDWQPDSPQYPEPRWDGSPSSKFRPRYPDATFAAVRKAIAPMRLGLWMSPLEFNPSSATYKAHPQWSCQPISNGLVAANLADPNGSGVSSSDEAGIGAWSNLAYPHIESRIRDAIEHWDARYFKFDFMVWLDCAGQNDFYQQHDAFVAMIDRLRHDYPDVVFQIDETNDYRLFPFESTLRGPTWFQNGLPDVAQLLHNLWLLGPYVQSYSIGQALLGGGSWKTNDVNTLMAAALPSAITFWDDPRQLPSSVIDTAARWIAFYKAHRDSFSLVTYGLLGDPLGHDWAALQEWDRDAQRGALLAFRQDSGSATKRIALRGVRPGLRFHLIEAPTGRSAGSVTSADLTRGIDVSLGSKGQARVLLIEPARAPPPAVRGPRGNPALLPKIGHCVGPRSFTFALHRPRGSRVVQVYAYVNARRVLHRRGRDIRRITLHGLRRAGGSRSGSRSSRRTAPRRSACGATRAASGSGTGIIRPTATPPDLTRCQSTAHGLGGDRLALLHRSPRVGGRRRRDGHARAPRGIARAARRPVRGDARRRLDRDAQAPGRAGTGASLAPASPHAGRACRAPLHGRLVRDRRGARAGARDARRTGVAGRGVA